MRKIQKLHAYIEQHRYAPFAWGVNDCCTFAADWVRELTGQDTMAALRASTARQASRSIAALGGLDAAVKTQLQACGIQYVQHEFVGLPGSLILFKTTRASKYSSHSIGICLGAVIAAPSIEGLAFMRLQAHRVVCALELI